MGERSGNLSKRDLQIHEVALLMADLEELATQPSDEHSKQRQDELQAKIEAFNLNEDEVHVAQLAKNYELARREEEDRMKKVKDEKARLEGANNPANRDPEQMLPQSLRDSIDKDIQRNKDREIRLSNLAQRLKSGNDPEAKAEFEALKDNADIRFVRRLVQREDEDG